MGARRVQEHVSLGGHTTSVDGDYGPATAAAVHSFQQEQADLEPTGRLTPATWHALTAPMRHALPTGDASERTFTQNVLWLAGRHLDAHPREVGSAPNSGPWVRLYLRGNEGREWLWCAGFATFVVVQAARLLYRTPPFPYTWNCDTLAGFGKNAGLFTPGSGTRPDLEAPALFVLRRTREDGSVDWYHAGLVVAFGDDHYVTIEGNTNDAGEREGYEVCRRTRAYAETTDFIDLDDR